MSEQMPITNNSGAPSFGSGSPLLGGTQNLINLMRQRALLGNAGGQAGAQVSPRAPIFPGVAQPPPVLSNTPVAIPRALGAMGRASLRPPVAVIAPRPPVASAMGTAPAMGQPMREDKMLILNTMANYLKGIQKQEHAERGI